MSQRTHNPGLLFTLWTVRYSLEQSRQTTGSWAPRVCGEVRRPVEVDSEHPTIPSVPCTPKGWQEPDLAKHPPATGGVAKGADWLLPNLCPPTAGLAALSPDRPRPSLPPQFSQRARDSSQPPGPSQLWLPPLRCRAAHQGGEGEAPCCLGLPGSAQGLVTRSTLQ